MSAVLQVRKGGPITCTPAEQVLGGQLVEGRAGGRIGVAAAGSTTVLGVALTDATSPEARSLEPLIIGGREVLDASALPTSVAVAYGGAEVPVQYAVAAAFGDRVVAAANGQVRPFNVNDPDGAGVAVADNPALIVGKCTDPDGVAAGAIGLMRTR